MKPVVGGLAFTVGTLDPYAAATAGAVAVLDHVHDPLHRRSAVSGRLEGGLAAGPCVRVGDFEYEVSLRDDALFSDGAAVTAHDAASSVIAMIEASGQKAQLLASALRPIRDAVAVADRTIRLTTSGPMDLLDERLALIRVIPEVWQDPDRRHEAPATGPYVIAEAGSERVDLLPADTYPGAATRPPLHLVSSVSPSERVAGLLDGSFDAIEEAPEDRAALIESTSGLRFGRSQGQNILWLMFNCSDDRLHDLRVRRALVHAVDRGHLFQLTDGSLEPADSLLPSWHPDHVACPTFPEFDPSAARRLLAEAGHPDGLEIRLAVSSASWVAALAAPIVDQLAEVGVQATVTVSHTADLFSTSIPEGDFDVLLASGDPSVYGPDGEFVLRWYLGGPWLTGYCHWSGETVDELGALCERAAVAPAPKRRHVLGRAQRVMADYVPIAPLGHRAQPSAWSSRLTGFRPSRTTGLDLRTPYLFK